MSITNIIFPLRENSNVDCINKKMPNIDWIFFTIIFTSTTTALTVVLFYFSLLNFLSFVFYLFLFRYVCSRTSRILVFSLTKFRVNAHSTFADLKDFFSEYDFRLLQEFLQRSQILFGKKIFRLVPYLFSRRMQFRSCHTEVGRPIDAQPNVHARVPSAFSRACSTKTNVYIPENKIWINNNLYRHPPLYYT